MVTSKTIKDDLEVQDYQFTSIDGKGTVFKKEMLNDLNISSFDMGELKEDFPGFTKKKNELLNFERKCAKKNNFKISEIVLEQRGLEKQEAEEYEEKIRSEVESRVLKLQEEAIKEGYNEGVQQGREEVYNETRAAVEEKITALNEMISALLNSQHKIISKQKSEIYTLINNLSKWIILRELKEDGDYLNRLLEKLVLEVQTKSNLLIQVNQKNFDKMPEVLKIVQQKLGEFVNVRVEVDYDIESEGLIVESENGIINATIEEQLKSLDKLFESVGING